MSGHQQSFRGKLGTGTRFKNCVAKKRSEGARDPEGLCASIGRKKFGKSRFQRLAAKGRK